MTQPPSGSESGSAFDADSAAASVTPTGRLFRVADVDPGLAPASIPVAADRQAERDSAFAAVAAYAFGDPDPTDLATGPGANTPVGGVDPAPEPTSQREPVTGLNLLGAWLVVIGATTIMAVADAIVRASSLGWLAGIGLLAATVYVAFSIRVDIAWWAVVIPPLAVAFAALTAGQLTLGGTGSLLLREVLMVFGALTTMALWTVGSMAAALVIVLVRRRRSSA